MMPHNSQYKTNNTHMKKYLLMICIALLSMSQLMAQGVEMATKLRSEGKIYVVVGVMLIIFLGVAIYLFSLDRRITKIEKHDK